MPCPRCRSAPLLAIGALALGLAATAAELHFPPAPGSGEIDGKPAIAVFPATFSGGRLDEVLAADGFTVHLVPEDAEDDGAGELTYPAATWFQPPPGRYRVWAQGGWSITPYTNRLIYAGRPIEGRGLARPIEVVDGGRVRLPDGVHGGSELRLLHADSYVKGGFLQREWSRRVPVGQIGMAGVLLPPGIALAGLWDAGEERYLAFSRPFEVSARDFVEAPLDSPSETAHVVVSLERPQRVRSGDHHAVDLSLRTWEAALPPDHLVLTAVSVHGVWYDVPPGPVELRAEGADVGLVPWTACLAAGEIRTHSDRLRRRPTSVGSSAASRAGAAAAPCVWERPVTAVPDDDPHPTEDPPDEP